MPEKPYDHNQIELKWHARWENADFYKAEENSSKPKFYVLEMLLIPAVRFTSATSATIRSATRWRAISGCAASTCCTPWVGDAFGLPAENAAIANKCRRVSGPLRNIAAMKKTHRRFAFSYDWDREVSTCEPSISLEPVVLPRDVEARAGLP